MFGTFKEEYEKADLKEKQELLRAFIEIVEEDFGETFVSALTYKLMEFSYP